MKQIQNIFLKGLLAFLPIAAATYIIYSCIGTMENLMAFALRAVLPVYIPGLGFLITILIILFFGFLLNNLITGSIIRNFEKKLTEIPFFKAVYSPLRDLMNLFSKNGQNGMKSVVLVNLGEGGPQVMGIVTRDQFNDFPEVTADAHEKIAVYVPLSYSVGGMTFLVNKNKVTPIDISVEKAMSLAITGWVHSDSKQKED